MKVFEVGLICEFEGGGRRVLMADNDRLFTNAKMYLLGAVDKHSEDMECLYGDEDGYSAKYADYTKQQLAATRKESSKARDDLNNSKSTDDLKKIRMEESSLRVIVNELEVLGGAK